MNVSMPCMMMNRHRCNVLPGEFLFSNLVAPVTISWSHLVTFVGALGANAPRNTMEPVRCTEFVMQVV